MMQHIFPQPPTRTRTSYADYASARTFIAREMSVRTAFYCESPGQGSMVETTSIWPPLPVQAGPQLAGGALAQRKPKHPVSSDTDAEA